MMEEKFSIENLEKAAICSNEISPNQESAISFLNEWCEQPNSIFSALNLNLNLIESSTVVVSRFIGSSLLKNKIADYWNQMNDTQKSNYRQSLTRIIYSLEDVNDNISYNLIQSFCTISIFDCKDDTSIIFGILDHHENTEEIRITIRILSSFLMEIDDTKLIIESHRNDLRQIIVSQYLEQFEYVCKNFLQVQEMSNDILIIINCFIRWSSLDNFFFDLEMLEQILHLLPNEENIEKVVDCLKSIFIDNKDSENSFEYSIHLIKYLSNDICQKELNVTSNSNFLIFLTNFINTIYDYPESVYVYKTEDPIDRVEESTDNETTRNEFRVLINVILSIPSDDLVDDLRSTYQNYIFKYTRIIYSAIEAEHKSLNKYHETLINDVLISVYNAQNYFEYNDGEIAKQMNDILMYLYLINSDSFIEFLTEQKPSPKMCWVIGSIQKNVDKSKQKIFIKLLINLIQYLDNDDSYEYLSALLYALPKWTSCFNLANNLFSTFNQIIFEAITKKDEKLTFCATTSFYEVVNEQIGLFKKDCLYYINNITNHVQEYLMNLDEKSLENLFLSCTKLIRYYKHLNMTNQSLKNDENNNISQSLHEKLFEPCVFIWNNIEQFQYEIVEKSLNVVGKVCIISKDTTNNIYDLIWPPLFQLACNSIPNTDVQNKFLENVLTTIAKIQMSLEYEKILPQIEELIDLMKQRGRVEDSFFFYFSKIRLNFKEFNDLYELVHQQFVIPFFEEENAPTNDLFKMIKNFDFDVVNIEWYTNVLIETMKTMGTDVVYNAIDAFINKSQTIPETIKIEFIKNLAPELIKTIIKSIIDLLHKPLLLKFAGLINNLFYLIEILKYGKFEQMYSSDSDDDDGKGEETKNNEEEKEDAIDYNELEDILKNAIASSLKEFASEPYNDFFDNFSEYLFHKTDLEINDAFSNLLIVLKKATPCDIEIFKVDIYNDFEDDDIFCQGFEEKFDDINERNDDLL